MARRQFPHRNERGAALGTARARLVEQGLAAAAAAVAFACYYATLLPGLDLGDSASFQTIAGSLTLNPRQAYPLYYALGNLFVWLHPGEPARAMNLASAVYGAGAVGIAAVLAARVCDSRPAGVVAGLYLAFSYTFWTQAITAEVYTLHLLLTGSSVLALLSWADRPGTARLALFYGLVALSFGNHLSTVLLLPGYALFMATVRRRGAADPLRLPLMLMACAIAVLGALQYAWNFRGLWAELEPPLSTAEALGTFWYDVTKADWRETLVMNVSDTGLQVRPAMYWFDLRQQFGAPGAVLAGGGALYLALTRFRRFLLLAALYAVTLAFAWTYNVGDAYIFFLPSHFIVAIAAGAGASGLFRMCTGPTRFALPLIVVLMVAYPAWRGYDTFAAVDRSDDMRADHLLDDLTSPAGHADSAIYGVDANWQVQNAVEYFMRERKPGVPWFTSLDLPWLLEDSASERWHRFVAANREIGRDVVMSSTLRDALRSIGVHTPTQPPADIDETTDFLHVVLATTPGTPYALSILMPDRQYPLDDESLGRAWRHLTGSSVGMPIHGRYTIYIGRAGSPPALADARSRPFRTRTVLADATIDVRMESWLPTDTIRRAGFGHVVVNRRHVLTLERGVSFSALVPHAVPVYLSGLFARAPRHVAAAFPIGSADRVIVDTP